MIHKVSRLLLSITIISLIAACAQQNVEKSSEKSVENQITETEDLSWEATEEDGEKHRSSYAKIIAASAGITDLEDTPLKLINEKLEEAGINPLKSANQKNDILIPDYRAVRTSPYQSYSLKKSGYIAYFPLYRFVTKEQAEKYFREKIIETLSKTFPAYNFKQSTSSSITDVMVRFSIPPMKKIVAPQILGGYEAWGWTTDETSLPTISLYTSSKVMTEDELEMVGQSLLYDIDGYIYYFQNLTEKSFAQIIGNRKVHYFFSN